MVKTTEIVVIDLMKPAKTVMKDMDIHKALHMMRTENIDLLSVVDDKHTLIGAVSEANMLKLVKQDPPSLGDPVWYDSLEHDAGNKPIETIMTRGITTIGTNDTAATALKVMSATGYKLLHVVGPAGRLLGIIRMKDIIDKLLGA
ncbi:MAG: CBS domain-containing protein [Candidatus Aenigmatarchaeota archaeon]